MSWWIFQTNMHFDIILDIIIIVHYVWGRNAKGVTYYDFDILIRISHNEHVRSNYDTVCVYQLYRGK